MIREKYNLSQELQKKNEELKGKKRLSLVGQGDFIGGNNVMRATMNIKHHSQHLTIHNPEFPFMFDGKENLAGENSTFYSKTDGEYKIVDIVKKYDEMMHGKTYFGLYFMYSKSMDKYIVIQRKECEDLTENFGFTYNNDYLDNAEIGDTIPEGTMITSSTSYDDNGNVGIGINGRILNAVHPAVQDDAIILSESFAKRAVVDDISTKVIPLDNNAILLNLYGKDGEHQGLPNIGDVITDGIICSTRVVKENRMFSDLRDSSLKNINFQADKVFYGEGEVVDINIYNNNQNLKVNKVNKQLIQYYTDAKWFYTRVYKICNKITKSGAAHIDKEIYRWKRLAMNYLDTQAVWAWNDNIFSGMMIEILLRKKESTKIGRKYTGRSGIILYWLAIN